MHLFIQAFIHVYVWLSINLKNKSYSYPFKTNNNYLIKKRLHLVLNVYITVIFITRGVSLCLLHIIAFSDFFKMPRKIFGHNYFHALRLPSVTLDHRHSSHTTSKEFIMDYCSLTRKRQMKQQPEKREIKK